MKEIKKYKSGHLPSLLFQSSNVPATDSILREGLTLLIIIYPDNHLSYI